MGFRRSGIFCALAFALAATFAIQGSAQTLTWDFGGASPASPVDGGGSWGNAWWSNGVADGSWVSGDTAQLGTQSGNTNPYTVTLAASTTAGGLIFQDQNYTVSSNTLLLSGPAPTITMNASAGTISSTLAGASGFTLGGSGILTLTAGNSISGSATMAGGVLQLGANNALQSAVLNAVGSGSVDFLSSVTSPTVAGLAGTNDITLPGTVGTLTLNPDAGLSPTYSGSLSAFNTTFSIAKTGAGTQTLSGTITEGSNDTTISGGTLNLNGSMSTNASHVYVRTATFNVNAGATFTMNGANQLTLADQNGNVAVMNIAGTANINSTGGADSLIGQASTGNGLINILSGGVLNVNNSGFRIANNGSSAVIGSVTLNPGSAMNLDSNDTGTGFVIQNGGSVTTSRGTLNLNGGTLTTGRVIRSTGAGVATLNFNGGWLVPTISSNNFISLNSNGSSPSTSATAAPASTPTALPSRFRGRCYIQASPATMRSTAG